MTTTRRARLLFALLLWLGNRHPAAGFISRLPSRASSVRATRRWSGEESEGGGQFVNVRRPSNAEGDTMLEWPSVSKRGSSDERYDGGESFYCLEGSVSCRVSTYLNGQVLEQVELQPGSLLEVESPCAINWVVPEGKSAVLLTPTYTEGPLFAVVVAGVLLSFGALIATALG
jgi:hypothetical protein